MACPTFLFSLLQLTIDEVQDTLEEDGVTDNICYRSSQKNPSHQKSSFVTKTYSFKRMLSFRGSLRGRGGRSQESDDGFNSSPMVNQGLSNLQPNHR